MNTEKMFALAVETYAEHHIDVENALAVLDRIPISIHAWQGDDVTGFENTRHALTGGCQVTGDRPGRARNADELRADLDWALTLIPGTSRVNLQAHQVDRMFKGVDRDAFTIENFSDWLAWSRDNGVALDIAPAFYSHPKLDHGFSLSHADAGIRKFWIRHGLAVRRIARCFGEQQQSAAVVNFWAPDGSKDVVADRWAPRRRLMDSLDEIFAEKLPESAVLDAVEGKLFGIGTESYTAGSNDFYMGYAASRRKLLCLDSGHFHPTESVADKLSAVLCTVPAILLHVSRGVRWDSDHVVLLNDELCDIARECVRGNAWDRIHIALDYFDASINRVAAWVNGTRNMRKALLTALLSPIEREKSAENRFDFTARQILQEAAKTLPWAAVWNHYCLTRNVPLDFDTVGTLEEYEKSVLFQRH